MSLLYPLFALCLQLINNKNLNNTWGYGLVWVNGYAWNSLPAWFHELGHNVGIGMWLWAWTESDLIVTWLS
jgi:hypothetical protein